MIIRTITVTCDALDQNCPAALIVPPSHTQPTRFAIEQGWKYDYYIKSDDGGGMLCPTHKPRKDPS